MSAAPEDPLAACRRVLDRAGEGIPEIGPEPLMTPDGRVRPDAPLLVDIRPQEEREAEGFIPGAAHIELHALHAAALDAPPDHPVIAYCRSGRRSLEAVKILRGAGWANALSLRGGVKAWRKRGGRLD